MKRLEERLSPVNQKRLRRFRRNKRARWSFWILVALYGLSLLSPVIGNRNPLYLRFNGDHYFPIFKYYPEDVFLSNGIQTRPDYKEIEKSDAFRSDPGNRMIFPPIRYGPYERVPKDEMLSDKERNVYVSLMPAPRTATVNVRTNLIIARAQAAGSFFDCDDFDVRDLTLADHWQVPDKARDMIAARFRNEASPAAEFPLQHATQEDRSTILFFTPYEPRRSAPKSVRIGLRAHQDDEEKVTIAFHEDGKLVDGAVPLWTSLNEDDRTLIQSNAVRRVDKAIDPHPVMSESSDYMASYERLEVQWPYKPVAGHIMGFDNTGRDVMVRIIYGMRISMSFGLILVVLSIVLGSLVGAIQGYYGGWIDLTAQRGIEIWSTLPFLYIMILLGSIYGRSFGLLLVAYGLFNWIGMSYYMRAEFLRLRKQPFVEAAKSLGVRDSRIIFRHILPNSLVPVITFFPFQLVGAIGSLAALDFLGFGLPAPTASWGEMLNQARENDWAWWLITWPSLALFIVILLGVFIGEGLRDAFDPRKHSRIE